MRDTESRPIPMKRQCSRARWCGGDATCGCGDNIGGSGGGQAVSERPAEALQYLGASFGLTQPLLNFWRGSGFRPMYLRQTASDVTGTPPPPPLPPAMPLISQT